MSTKIIRGMPDAPGVPRGPSGELQPAAIPGKASLPTSFSARDPSTSGGVSADKFLDTGKDQTSEIGNRREFATRCSGRGDGISDGLWQRRASCEYQYFAEPSVSTPCWAPHLPEVCGRGPSADLGADRAAGVRAQEPHPKVVRRAPSGRGNQCCSPGRCSYGRK